ncbi:Predicted DNA-binding transcriptional regulator YafY, contains an HTH and WYL domains [Fictibacillus solisalsi]|uniref:Predicted DNA-binding transcriptional regulator YafY, contains an HTH and WYL domains n=1 Tax=Fictibacillus solisalsi TaxID=459525 RepID=A0A1H0A1D4_9BACL|nr:YafY family protein [Fictibacillus solisalsi]SDN27360.1 Predicted DNA-binding transcriptional regulator YafY, contains an HTH and WYL domains [Fictibacillus solisalsi]
MRADRLISILLLLQNRGKLTTKELAYELEVNPRTIHRDMDALSSAGFPVIADRGTSGGWRLLESYKTNLTGLKGEEIKSLFLLPSVQLLKDLGISEDWFAAREKLLASLPASSHGKAQDVWDRIHIDTSSWRQSPEKVTAFTILKESLWQNKKLHIHYERADGERRERTVSPLGLVAKSSTWYFIAGVDQDIRTYRASRILSAQLTEQTFERPADFNLAAVWEQSSQQFIQSLPAYQVEAELSSSILSRIRFTGRFVQQIQIEDPLPNGWIPASFCFDTEEEAAQYILGFGRQIRIVSPKRLKDIIYTSAKSLVEMLENDS